MRATMTTKTTEFDRSHVGWRHSCLFLLLLRVFVVEINGFQLHQPPFAASRTKNNPSNNAKSVHKHQPEYARRQPHASKSPNGDDGDGTINSHSTSPHTPHGHHRRAFLLASSSLPFLLLPTQSATAGIDPSALKNYSVEGDQTGVQTRLRQIEMEKNRPSDVQDVPYIELDNGVSYREYREGRGDATVQPGSRVAAEMTIRCKSFATANEPGGLKYFASSTDTDFNELAWTIGSSEPPVPPEVEQAMMGMKKNSIRRIEIPSTAAYAAKKRNQLPLPTTKDGKRRFENVFKTEATLLFEVLVTRIK